jgi:hypothetical protein
MEYFNDILCVQAAWLIDNEVMTKVNYDKLKQRGWLRTVRKPSRGNPALIAYDSLPERFRHLIVEKFGNPYESVKPAEFADYIERDGEAWTYYSKYEVGDGKRLPDNRIREYCTNAEILNAVNRVVNKRAAKRRSMGGRKTNLWENIHKQVMDLNDETAHTLPKNLRRFRDRLKDYKERGYEALIHKGYCNTNSRKVNKDIEALILSIYAMPNKPFAKSVHDLYLSFLAGNISVADTETGEIFDRNDFFNEDGTPITLSEATIWNYLRRADNDVSLSKVRNSSLEFSSNKRPHHHRDLPNFSLSQISMDDRDLPRKMADGKRVKAYYGYDVASGAVVGASYSKLKDTQLFINCMRDMFRFIHLNGLGMPLEVEVEHHLVNQFKDDLMQAGTVFPFVRWCNPGNSQEKWAETGNRVKKYGYEKRHQDGIGRFYAKLEANRPKVDKVSDAENNNYNDKRYTFEQLVADDRETIEAYNNDLHPNQKKYPGKTRLDVLIQHQNPDAAKIDDALITRYIGDKVTTSIRRSQYVRVRYADYQLSTPRDIAKLQPNNYKVDAYYIPVEDGSIDKVYIYQDAALISECYKIEKYNRATAEQTDADHEAYLNQSKYVSEFDAWVKKTKPAKVAIVENDTTYDDCDVEEVDMVPVEIDNDFDYDDDEDYAQRALNDI